MTSLADRTATVSFSVWSTTAEVRVTGLRHWGACAMW
jgi:hypothetical protein